RSRPGWSLGGTICAPGGTTCATAANETLTIAKAAAMARTPAGISPTPQQTDRNFTRGGEPEQSPAGSRFAIFPDVSIRSHRLAATLQVAVATSRAKINSPPLAV